MIGYLNAAAMVLAVISLACNCYVLGRYVAIDRRLRRYER